MNINLQQILKSSLLGLLLLAIPIFGTAQVGLKQKEVGFLNKPIEIQITSVSNVKPTLISSPSDGEVIDIIKLENGIHWILTYQPNPDFIGFDDFTVAHQADYPPGIVVGPVNTTVQITVVPSLVEAQHDYGITTEGETLTIKVIDNDSVSHGELSLNPVFPVVNHGKASASSQRGFVDFKPEAGFTGLADFNYIACDELGTCATGAASVYVNPKGKMFNDAVRLGTGQNTKKSIPMPFKVTRTDLTDNVKIEVSKYAVVYEPSFDFVGQEEFTVYGENGNQRTITIDVIERNNNFLGLAVNDVNYALLGETVQVDVLANDPIESISRVEYYALNGGTVEEISQGVIAFTPNKGFSGVARIAYRAYDANFNENWAYAYIIYNRHNFGPNDQDYTYEFYVNPGQTRTIEYEAPVNNYQLLADDNSETYGDLEAMSKGSLIYYAPEEAGFSDEFEVLYCAPANSHPDDCQKVKVTMHIVDEVVANGCSNDCVLPGDLNADGIVNSVDLLPLGLHIGAQGPARTDKSTQFEPHLAADWDMSLIQGSSTNLKHHDANGDGILTEKDVQAIVANYGQVNHLIPYSAPALSKGINVKANRVTPSKEDIPVGDPIPAGTLIEIEIALGEEGGQELDLYGFTFPFKMGGKSFIDPASLKVTFHDDSWAALNSPTLTLQKEVAGTNADQVNIDFAFTRTSKTDVSGMGKLATVGFVIVEDFIDIRLPNEEIKLDIEIGQAYSIDGNGQYYQYEGSEVSLPISFEEIAKEEPLIPSQLNLFPNPATDRVNIRLENGSHAISNISIFNLSGQEVYRSVNLDTRYFPIPTYQLPEGLYIAQVLTDEGLLVKKFEVVRK